MFLRNRGDSLMGQDVIIVATACPCAREHDARVHGARQCAARAHACWRVLRRRVGRARKNAGLDCPRSLEKSERWLRASLGLGPTPEGERQGDSQDAAYATDQECLQALSEMTRASPVFWKAWRTVAARRAIDTFEQGAAAREALSGPTAPAHGNASMRVTFLLEALEGHLTVFVVEDAETAAHLARVVRVGQTRAAWDPARRLWERRLDRDFEARAARSYGVLVEEARRHLELARRVQRLAGIARKAPDTAVDCLVPGLVANAHVLSTHLRTESPGGDRTQRAVALASAMKRWCAERCLPEPAEREETPAAVLSARWTELFLRELDALRSTSSAHTKPPPTRTPSRPRTNC